MGDRTLDKLDFKKIYENKPLFYGIIAGVVIFLALAMVVSITTSISSTNRNKGVVSEKIIKDPLELFTTDKIGLAIEVQALLAREGIDASRKVDGTKSVVYLANYTMSERDRALLAIVKSGLVDQHVGLEIFDKGDFTSTKEDKKIRLVRAINGELARLIRKIPPIENAQVFVSIPEQTLFASKQKPITATVQITLPSGERLDNMKVKAITNLLLGAVQDLQADNISITDTNGNVYNSIISDSDDALSKIEENDKYMQTKVSQQLDRLVGKGNYVVTVSTFLTQAPVEKTSIIYNPNEKTSVSEQGFTESLGDDSSDVNSATSAVSTYLPYGLPNSGSNSSQNRSYTRRATETQYGVSKTQINEYAKAGVIENISIAVSLEQSAVPLSMTMSELKSIIASAASPLVNPDDVAIAFIDSSDTALAPDRPNELPRPEESGNHWWVVGLALLGGLGFGLKHIMSRVRKESEKQEEELEFLREMTQRQQKQLEDVNTKAVELIQRQELMAQNLIEQQSMQAIQAQQAQARATVQTAPKPQPSQNPRDIDNLISDLSGDFDDLGEDVVIDNLRKWIDS